MAIVFLLILISFFNIKVAFAQELSANDIFLSPEVEDDLELLFPPNGLGSFSCRHATPPQIRFINIGNLKLNKFLAGCFRATGNSHWCNELVRPNPDSHPKFDCTYGSSQAHFLIHPNEETWKYAFAAISLIKELERAGLKVCSIYNWWRPEPYNQNVGGVSGRHPLGTSVDVRFCSDRDAIIAFNKLCEVRRQGRIRAIGYYGTSALHFGMGDRVANTWGRSCR